MNNTILIDKNETIGDSLSSINLNFLNLEKETLSISYSAQNYWNKVYEYYVTFGSYIKEITTLYQNVSAQLSNNATLVERNSAAWIKPITIFYPSIFDTQKTNTEIQDILLKWVKNNFPVFPTDQVLYTNLNTGNVEFIKNKNPAYVENQKLIVYTYTWFSTPEVLDIQNLSDYTTCSTQDAEAYLECSSRWYGGTYCGTNTWVPCDSQTEFVCYKPFKLSCNFTSPPYEDNQTFSKTIDFRKNILFFSRIANRNYRDVAVQRKTSKSFIRASIETYHVDRYEDSVKALVFTIKDCNWVYERSIL